MARRDTGFGPKLRLLIGSFFLAFIWCCYFAKLTWGIGFMHDLEGNITPTIHYLVGALVVTAMVLAWIFGSQWWERRQRE